MARQLLDARRMRRSALLCLVVAVCVAACGTQDEPRWQLLAAHEPPAMLAVWGSSRGDVWGGGGRAAFDGPPTILHYQAPSWTEVPCDVTGIDLWWVFGFVGGDVLFAGSGGTILKLHDGVLAPMPTPGTGTIFGMWGASADDMWAVGDGGVHGLVWHFDGTQW